MRRTSWGACFGCQFCTLALATASGTAKSLGQERPCLGGHPGRLQHEAHSLSEKEKRHLSI